LPDPDLIAWAAGLSRSGGRFPLLGSGSRAEAYPALLWSGTRLHRTALPPEAGLMLLAHVTADAGAQVDLPVPGDPRLEAAVGAGLRVLARLPASRDDAPASAGLEVLAAAATAAVAFGADDDLDAVLDLAGTLAVVGPAAPVTAGADVRAGHALAVGWLAVRLLTDGLVAPVAAARATAWTVMAAEPSWSGSWS